MERDFLGIHSKILHPDAAKGDARGIRQDAAILAGPSLQWPFSNKASAMQHFMLYKASQEERPRNHHALPKHHPSLRSQPLLNVPVFEPNQMAYPALAPQKFFSQHLSHQRNPYFKITEKQPFVGGAAAEVGSSGHRTAQLTIFYDGCVNVFDDVPSDKARSIMSSLANRGPNEASVLPASSPSSRLKLVVAPPISVSQQEATPRAIPQARKASLARFLEKRKERLTTAMPYSSTKMSSENESRCNASSTSNSSAADTDLSGRREASCFAGHLKNSVESISTELTI